MSEMIDYLLCLLLCHTVSDFYQLWVSWGAVLNEGRGRLGLGPSE